MPALGEHYAPIQRSNSAAANSMVDTIVGRPGFRIVIDKLVGRAQGSTNNWVSISGSDSVSSSFVMANDTASAGNFVSCEYTGPHAFGEGLSVLTQVNGQVAATSVGYTVDYHYEPALSGT